MAALLPFDEGKFGVGCWMNDGFNPSRLSCYTRLVLISSLGWLIAIFRPRLPNGMFDNLGWWLALVIPLAVVCGIAILIIGFGFWNWFCRWEGPITNFIHSDIERIAGKTPFPNICQKILYGVILVAVMPFILLLIPSGE